MVTFVVEHLEEEFYPWCQHEYSLISELVGKERLLLTNFPYSFDEATCTAQSVTDYLKDVPLERICLLDSEATETLEPADAQNFDYFLFGGILGNVDEFDFDRTSVLRKIGFPRRALGSMQMTTDTAVRVSSLILLHARPFPTIPFIDRPEFEVDGQQERLVMDFRYVKDEETGEPLICPKVLELLKADFNFDYDGLE